MAKDLRSLSEDEKAGLLREIGAELQKLERKHGEAAVRWAVNRRQAKRTEQRKLNREKADLEKRLAELGGRADVA